MNDPVLSVRGVSLRYGARTALQEVSVDVGPGELVALAGPNGSGKSSLMRVAAGLESPSEGAVRIGERDLTELRLIERARRVAWMPQEEAVDDDLSVRAYVRYGRHPYIAPLSPESRADHEAVREALALVGGEEFADRTLLSLSGGERQRVRLARVLAQSTPLLLLDEPTAHLDIGHQLDVLERVRAAARARRLAVVAALHDLNLAADFADRVVVLSNGRKVADGPPSAVLSSTLLARVWGIEGDLRRDERSGRPYLVPRRLLGPPSRAGTGLGPVHVVGGGGVAAPVLRDLADAGFELSVGALHLLDSDMEVAEALAIPAAVEAPFAPLGEAVRERNRELLRAARAIVVAPFAVGPSNLANLLDLAPFLRQVPVLILSEPPIASRDFTGGLAVAAYQLLLEGGAQEVAGAALRGELSRRLSGAAERPLAPSSPATP